MDAYGSLNVSWAQGYKGDEISHIDAENVCFACGNTVKFVDVVSGKEHVFHSPGSGVKTVATAPTHGLFALAEMGLNPRIFVCRYPTLEVVCTLEGGALLEYTRLAFSFSGSSIAACSGLPDFTLYVWDWSNGDLKCKAQMLSEDEVTSLLFNPLSHHHLSLIGPDKVSLWTIEECNDVSTLKSRKIPLPTSDGTLLHEEDETASRSATRMGFHVSLPASTRAGLSGEQVIRFQAPEQRHPRVSPTSQCWSSRGEVYVGCKDGQLFRVDGDNGHCLLVLGGTSDNLISGEIEAGMFNTVALNMQGLTAGGTDGCLRSLHIDNNGIKIDQTWKGNHPITTISFSPNVFVELVYGTGDGTIHRFNTVEYTSCLVADKHIGQFVEPSYANGGRYCVTCREDGELQVWESESGFLIATLSLNVRVTSLACCPSCPIVAVGTWTGHICYIDITSLNTEDIDLRQIASIRMHHGSVNFLKYDTYGKFLVSACSDESQVFIINSKPSTEFACIGYIDCGGMIMNLSIHQQASQSNIVAVVQRPPVEDIPSSSNTIVIFSLTSELLQKPDDHFRSLRRDFKDQSVNCTTYELSMPIDSAVITAFNDTIQVAALSTNTKKLVKFQLPLQKRQSQTEEAELIEPVSEHVGHQLGGGILTISPHGKWLASSSKDGSIVIRDLIDWDSYVAILAHSYMEGGVKAIAFSPDANQIASVGMNDSSFACFTWDFTAKGRIATNASVEFARTLNMQLRSEVDVESEAIIGMEEWCPQVEADKRATSTVGDASPTPLDGASDEKPDELRPTSGVQSEITMTPTPTPAVDATWLDNRVALAVKEENAKYDEVKRELRKNIKELRKTILGMMEVNNNLPELEQLRHDEYNLDAEEQKRMQADQDTLVHDVREEINLENLAQRYLTYLIKKECWDDMVTKGRALKTFTSNVTVNNYPTRSVTSQESALLQKITQMRNIEISENAVRKSIVEAATSKTTAGGEEEDEDEETTLVGLSLHGSLGPKYSGGSDLFYSQFEIHTREEKMTQIVLVKDAICRVKEAFNEAFSNVLRNKEQEIGRIKERNVRIRAIMKELDMDSITVVDPAMDEDEMPEKVFEVSDDEVKVERVLSEEQRREKEEQERIEEERKAAAKGDNKRERGLVDMMGGVLEVKKEDMLKQDIPPPDFVEEKLEKDWTDEEKKRMKDHEKKLKDLQEEREKYRKNLENELKKLQQSNIDGMASFDESLAQLFNRKLKTEMVVNQEELKIVRMTSSINTEDELSTQEAQLNYMFELKSKIQGQAMTLESDVRKKVDDYREVYDSVVAEDKMLDRGFKREFSDVPLSLSDQLYKLFRRRPRVQRQRTLDERTLSLDPYGMTDRGSLAHPSGADISLDALAELDDEVNMPEGVDHTLWGRLCDARRIKVESELRVKQSAMTLAEMTQYLQSRQDELDKLNREIDDLVKQQSKLCEDSMKNTLNLEVQFLLKQGQVEVHCGQYIPDYSDSILMHRGVVEDLNGTIRTLGESKVAAMTESKDFKKGIHQLEWDRKRMIMQMEDLHNRARHIQMLKLTKDLQAFLNEENHSAKQSKQIAVLEQTLALQDKQLEKNVSQKDETTSHLTRTIKVKEYENKELGKVLEDLHVSVSERQNIAQVNAGERAKNTADKRLRGIVQRRKLVDLAKAQAQEVAVLRAEVERLRMKTFPALVQVER